MWNVVVDFGEFELTFLMQSRADIGSMWRVPIHWWRDYIHIWKKGGGSTSTREITCQNLLLIIMDREGENDVHISDK